MATLKKKVFAFLHDEKGLTAVEYAIAGGLIGAAVILSFSNLGSEVVRVTNLIVATLQDISV